MVVLKEFFKKVDSEKKPENTLMVGLKEFFKKVDSEKNNNRKQNSQKAEWEEDNLD